MSREQDIRQAWDVWAPHNKAFLDRAASCGDTVRLQLSTGFYADFPPDMAAEIGQNVAVASVDVHPQFNDPGDDYPRRGRQVRWVCEGVVLTSWQPL